MNQQEAQQLDREIRKEIAGSPIWVPLGVRETPFINRDDHRYFVYLYHLPKRLQVPVESREYWEDLKAKHGVHAPPQ